MSIYDSEPKRTKALKRAEKMKKLFDKENFGPIMKAIDPIPSPGTFTAACRNAGLNDDEITWLWAYLKECKKALYDPIPEAAGTGW